MIILSRGLSAIFSQASRKTNETKALSLMVNVNIVIFRVMRDIWKMCVLVFLFCYSLAAFAFDKGIYLGEGSFYSDSKLNHLIRLAKTKHLDTFIIDYTTTRKSTTARLNKLHGLGIKTVARVVVFPHGGHIQDIRSASYLQKRYNQISLAANAGFDAIQLDYIRYSAKADYSPDNVHDIAKVVAEVHKILQPYHKELQIDIFGEAASFPSKTIGQDATLLAPNVNTICPMVYPSHYHPHEYYTKRPYQTIYKSITDLKKQLVLYPDVKVIAYIEMTNFRQRMSMQSRAVYVQAQINGARDAGASGWYGWSANNYYDVLQYTN